MQKGGRAQTRRAWSVDHGGRTGGRVEDAARSSLTNPPEALRSLAKEMRADTLYQRDDRMYAHCVRSEQV